jgi:hypothetical protein
VTVPGEQTMMKSTWKDLFTDQSGAMAVVMALLLVVVLAVAALGVDYGYMAMVQGELQKAADAGALAGARALGSSSNPDWPSGQVAASNIVRENNAAGQPLTDCQVDYGYWSKVNHLLQPYTITPQSTDNPAVRVMVAKSDGHNDGPLKMLFAPIFGVQTMVVSAGAVAMFVPSTGDSPFDYTIFSGSDSYTLPLNGSQKVIGSVHSNDDLSINGSNDISKAAEAKNKVNINGSNDIGSVKAGSLEDITINGSNDIGSQSGGATKIDMPDYTQQIADIAAQVYDSNKVFNGSVDVNGSIYVNGDVILNGSIDSTGAILATGNITVNGSSTINGSNQVCLYSANGNIIMNGASNSGGASMVIYAPHGTITINGSMHFNGRIIGNKVNINGSGEFNGDDYPVTTLPVGKGRGKAVLVH